MKKESQNKDLLESENKELLNSFVEYCHAHPEEKFWEALKGWCDNDYVLVGNLSSRKGMKNPVVIDGMKVYLQDTYFFNGREN